MLISYDNIYFIVLLINMHAVKLLVATGVTFCEYPISIIKNCKYSPVWQFVNCALISAYIYYASMLSIILNSMCNASFGSGISSGDFPVFLLLY